MADAADQPRTGSSDIAPAAPAGGPAGRDAIRTFAPPPPPETIEGYRPLAAAAIAGFLLAVFYGLYIVGYALLTLVTGDFLFQPGWTLLLPLGVLLVCWFGRRSIRHSEGALGGEKLANWGLGITVVVALGYWAYHAATVLALRQQGIAFVEAKFLPPLVKGKIEEAFLLTYPPPRPAASRDFIEKNLNTQSSLRVPGRYTLFTETEYVRLLQMAGEQQSEVALKTVNFPILDKSEMHVPLLYHVKTPMKEFDLQVVAVGLDSRNKDAPGRQWRIDADTTGVVRDSSVFTEAGQRFIDVVDPSARGFLLSWVNKVTGGLEIDLAYLYTLSPKEREALAPHVRGKSEAELNKAAATNPAVRDYLKGVNEFRAGGVVNVDPKNYWVADALRNEGITETKRRFRSVFATKDWMRMSDALPAWEVDGNKVRLYYDVMLQMLPAYAGSGRLVVEADKDVLTNPKIFPDLETWRLVRMDLVRFFAAPQDSRKSPQPAN